MVNPNDLINNFRLLNKDNLISSLIKSLSEAKESIIVVGPWIDSFFVNLVIKSLSNKEISVKFIVRIEDEEIDDRTISALNLAREYIEDFQAKTIENLHSKVIMIDNCTFFLGSANWLWYSLNKGVEIAINGETSILPELSQEIEQYWRKGKLMDEDEITIYRNFTPILDIKLD